MNASRIESISAFLLVQLETADSARSAVAKTSEGMLNTKIAK